MQEKNSNILLLIKLSSNHTGPSLSMVSYDDMRELEQLAAEQGLTVEEFKEKVNINTEIWHAIS